MSRFYLQKTYSTSPKIRLHHVFFFLYIMLILPQTITAQNKLTDSLETALESAKSDSARVKTLLLLGREQFNLSAFEQAIQRAREASNLARKTGLKKEEALSYNLMGSIYRGMGNYEASLKQHFTALKIREGIADSFGIANSYNNIGLLYWGMEKYDLALAYHLKALRIRENAGDSDVIAASHLNLGMTYYKQGMASKNKAYAQDLLQSALHSYERALKYFESKQTLQSMAACYNNMANVYADKATLLGEKEKKGKNDFNNKSLEYYFKTLKIMESAGDVQSVVITQNNISLIYREQGQFGLAADYALKSLGEAQMAGFKNESMEIYENLSRLFEMQGNYQKAFEYHKLYAITKDSLLNEEGSKQVIEMQTKYETEKKDKELLKKDAETKQAAMQRNFFIGGFAMMILLAFFIFRGYRQKQKANLEISRQKHIVEEKQKEIIDSITYARRIQRTLLTSEKYIQKQLKRLRTPGN